MKYEFMGATNSEQVKVPAEIARKMPRGQTVQEQNDYIDDAVVYSGAYYGKIIPKPIADFLMYVNANSATPGGYPVCEETGFGDLTVCVVGYTRENKAHVNMFAYRTEGDQKTAGSQTP